jgi:TetR/AcrR family transcriptional regulator, copper-responsive repressor
MVSEIDPRGNQGYLQNEIVGNGDALPRTPLPQPPLPHRGRGRPRGFDPVAALETAMRVFWAEGFDGASVDTLARETGMPRATLYQLHGDKEGLFLAAIRHYAETRTAQIAEALGPRGTLRDDLGRFFAAVIDLALAEPGARGCLISCVLADAAGANPRLRAELDRRFLAVEARIRARLDASTPADSQTLPRAMVIASIARGLTLRARGGADRALLEQAAADALDLLAPGPTAPFH